MTERDPLRDRFTHLVDDLRQLDAPIPDIDGVYRRAARRRTTHVAAVVVAVLVLLGGTFVLRPSNGQTESPIGPGPTTATAPEPVDPTFEPPPSAPVPTDGGGGSGHAGALRAPASAFLTASDVEDVFAGYFYGSNRWTSASQVPTRLRSADSCAPGLTAGRVGVLAREATSPAEEAAIESVIAIVERDVDAEYGRLRDQIAACAVPIRGDSEPRVELPRSVVYENDLGCALSCTAARIESVVIAHTDDRIAVVTLWHYGQDTAPDETLVDLAQRVVERLES